MTDSKKVSGELFSLTYGALVAQIVRDYSSVEEVNKQLEKMGYNVGVRIIEDFLARTKEEKCADFRQTSEKVQAGFKLYLNVSPTVTSWSAASDEFSLVFEVIILSQPQLQHNHNLNFVIIIALHHPPPSYATGLL